MLDIELSLITISRGHDQFIYNVDDCAFMVKNVQAGKYLLLLI